MLMSVAIVLRPKKTMQSAVKCVLSWEMVRNANRWDSELMSVVSVVK
jgi:hypothetical protein